jgi:hypothetical protein
MQWSKQNKSFALKKSCNGILLLSLSSSSITSDFSFVHFFICGKKKRRRSEKRSGRETTTQPSTKTRECSTGDTPHNNTNNTNDRYINIPLLNRTKEYTTS